MVPEAFFFRLNASLFPKFRYEPYRRVTVHATR